MVSHGIVPPLVSDILHSVCFTWPKVRMQGQNAGSGLAFCLLQHPAGSQISRRLSHHITRLVEDVRLGDEDAVADLVVKRDLHTRLVPIRDIQMGQCSRGPCLKRGFQKMLRCPLSGTK